MSLKGKHIVLGISGGIAAYKSAYLLRLFIKEGAEVQVVMTPAAKEFITPVTMSALSGKPVVSEFFTANSGEWHSHVDLGLWADIMIIAPATASTIAKMANGVADNMLITTYLSAKEKVMVAPAMDLDMWAHPATQRNIATLKEDGVGIIEPTSGELASHLTGKGRMEEPEGILKAVKAYFEANESAKPERLPLQGKKVALTVGPTFEGIDPVRFIGNRSTGKMGIALAEEFARLGAEVTMICGPVNLQTGHESIHRINVESALEMLQASQAYFSQSDIGVFAAAVADYRPAHTHSEKIKRGDNESMEIRLVRNPDIAATLARDKKEGQIFVGFALETDKGIDEAKRKLKRKNLDAIVLNTISDPGAGFATDTNKITILTQDKEESYPLKSKREVAGDIVDFLINECGIS